MSNTTVAATTALPTFFVSHGAPSFLLYNDSFTDKAAYKALKQIGSSIRKMAPDYLVVVSAHWESAGENTVEISHGSGPDAENKLIYDFYGFPDEMYRQKFQSKSDPNIAHAIKDHLGANGFKSKVVDRGLDHGAWVPLKIAFGEGLDIPIIQVSLTSSNSFDNGYKLGKTLKYFRDNMIWDPVRQQHLRGQIICSGSSVHNLRDLQRSFSFACQVMPYASKFNRLISETFEASTPLTVLQNLNNFKKDTNYKQLLYQSHPTLEHFMPLVVAAGSDDGKIDFSELYTSEMFSIGFGFYRFGNLVQSS